MVVPTSAHAEVLDKCEMPWAASSIVAALAAALFCATLASTRIPALQRTASVVGIIWIGHRIAFDEILDDAVGPALRVELGAHRQLVYVIALGVVATLPWLAVAACGVYQRGGRRIE